MKTANHIESLELEFLKREDGLSFYRYRAELIDGVIMEGDDYISAYRDINKAKTALIGLLNAMINDLI